LWTQTIHNIKMPLARQIKLCMSTPTATPNTSGGTWAAMAALGSKKQTITVYSMTEGASGGRRG
jgi:hypothetical protein